tara:strand:+ start:1935 stop:2150 length:216 start_codon:yes stop_codon:yes gene_type:complete
MKVPMFFGSAMKHYSAHKELMTHDPSEGPRSDKKHRHPDKPTYDIALYTPKKSRFEEKLTNKPQNRLRENK